MPSEPKRETGKWSTIFLGMLISVAGATLVSVALVYSGVLDSEFERMKYPHAAADLKSIASALDDYRSLSGNYPTTDQGLQALVEKPDKPPVPEKWNQRMDSVPIDPWGNPYQYRAAGDSYALFTLGTDCKESADDLHAEPERRR